MQCRSSKSFFLNHFRECKRSFHRDELLGEYEKAQKPSSGSKDEEKVAPKHFFPFSNERRSVLSFYCVIIEIGIFCNKSSSEERSAEGRRRIHLSFYV
jgi:hypothetical protein